MYLIDKEIKPKNSKEIRIYFIGDAHIGSEASDKQAYEQAIKEVKDDENGYLIGMGDDVDAIIPTDKRFNLEELDIANKFAHSQFQFFENRLEMIRDKIIGIHIGNHGSVYAKSSNFNEYIRISQRLGTNFMGEISITTLKIKGIRTINIHSAHGTGGGYLEGSFVNKLRKEEGISKNCQVYAMGHSHRLIHFPACIGLEKIGKILYSRYAMFINTGSFLRGMPIGITTYAEAKHYPPLPIGYSVLHITKERLLAEDRIIDKKQKW